jgi:hypothetical protein
VTDNELDIWRRQWHSQPAVPIDLIRKVERQTVYMKLQRLALIAPLSIGVGTVVLAVMMPTIPWILLAVGTWVFILIGLWFEMQNSKGIWVPAAETTAAYVDLSIERCRRQMSAFRYFFVFAPLLTAFVMVAVFQVLASYDAIQTTRDYVFVAGSFAYSTAVVGVVAAGMVKKRRKVRAELDYLLNLQRQLGA